MRSIVFLLLVLAGLEVYSQTGKFIADSKSGCLIWSEEYSPKDRVQWSGGCNGGYANGQGVLNWYEEEKLAATYTGQMVKGKITGTGKFVISDFATFQGNFLNGALNGKGAAYFKNGGKTIGNFDHGTFLNLDDKYLPLLKKRYIANIDTTGIYNDSADKRLFYYTLVPHGKIKAVLALFPSTGESVENVISCNKILIQLAFNNNILPVILSANYNQTLESHPAALEFFDVVFNDVVQKFKAPRDKFILSGLSLGGMNVLQYTEMSRNQKYTTAIKPLAVIGVDPPVDMMDLYNGAKQQIKRYEKEGNTLSESRKIALKEDRFLIDSFERLYGGTPEQVPDRYIAGSQFSRNEDDGGNAKYLIDVPVRLYCDPDIVWQLKNKGRDYYNLNAANLSAMANFLMQKGNKRAEFIPAIGKGFRVDGTRHPHSWSIVDPGDCIKWIIDLVR